MQKPGGGNGMGEVNRGGGGNMPNYGAGMAPNIKGIGA